MHLAAARQGHATTGDQGTSPWLLPGGRPGQPISPYRLSERLRQIGIHIDVAVAVAADLRRRLDDLRRRHQPQTPSGAAGPVTRQANGNRDLLTLPARVDRGLAEIAQARRKAPGGEGPEDFHGRPGWQETGRWPGALRFNYGDRDEVLMLLALP
jgi:hypothetical protein